MNLEQIKSVILERYPIVSVEHLNKYMEICSYDDDSIYTEKHHILPQSIWPEYGCLDDFTWNVANLSYMNHCRAHWHFALATNDCWRAIQLMIKTDANGARIETISNLTKSEIAELDGYFEYAKYHFNHTEETRKKMSVMLKGKKKSAEHVTNMMASIGLTHRIGEHWNYYDELMELWVNTGKLTRTRFKSIAVANNYPDGNYQGMIRKFQKDLQTINKGA